MNRPTLHLPERGRRDAVEWEAAANRHRPIDPDLLADAVRDMARSGLTARDVAQALRIDRTYVETILASQRRAAGA